ELAISIAYFDDLSRSAMEAKDPDVKKTATRSPYDCKWVRLSGFLTWSDYYHYRGRLYESAWHAYGGNHPGYIVERFADPAVRRSQLAQRQITLVGRFYDLCAAADRVQKKSGENWMMLFGPCHYGSDRGMMLTDVVIKEVHDDAPRYILGESNRKFFKQLI